MSQIELTPAQRKTHRAQAHHLDPVVMIGAGGLTEAVLKEANAALQAHELIKIRVLEGEHQAREALLRELADGLGAAAVQHIGKLLVLWRPRSDQPRDRIADEDRRPGPKDIKVIKHSKRGGQRPEVKVVRVLGNQRLTPGGKLKKAQPRQKSIKKNRAD